MHNIQAMEIGYGTDQLLEILCCFIFGNFCHLYDVIKQLSFLNILHNQEQMLRSFNNLVKLNDVRVPYQFKNVNLSVHSLNIRQVQYFFLFKDFNGYFFARQSMRCEFHFPKRSFAQSFSKEVITDSSLGLHRQLIIILQFIISLTLTQQYFIKLMAGGGSSHTGPTLVFFVIFCVLVGAICRSINKQTKFPYTPLILMAGLIFGYFKQILGENIGGGAALIATMDPHLILFIFIPVLLFEEGFNCDWYVFKKSFTNIMILAIPGILWGIVILAFILKYVLGYSELSWSEVLTIGSVLSSTDAVAVVSLLKQLGAHVRFNTLVAGQSLLNDGTTILFFLLFLGAVKGEQTTPMDFVSNCIRIGVGGPLVGIAGGALAAYFLSRIIRDDIQTANVTFIACYLSFWAAEYTFMKVSGVVVVVVLALYLAAMAKTRIHPESQHSLHSVWAYIQYLCETVIFLLTGIIIGVNILDKSTIVFADWVKMLIFFVLMIIARGIMVLTFFPILKMFGYGINYKEFLVLVYGGLRGALGLCLALIVAMDSTIAHVRFKQLTIFYLSGMVILTMMINGTTCGFLVNYLGMIERPPIKQKLYQRCLEEILNKTTHQIEQLKGDRFLQLVDWGKVEFYLADQDVRNKIYEINQQIARTSKGGMESLNQLLTNKEAQKQLRYKTIKLVQTAVWQKYEKRLCEENAAKLLDEVCMINLDESSSPIKFWENMTPSFISQKNLTFWLKLQKMPIVGPRARNQIVAQLYSVYESASIMIAACEEALEIMEGFPVTQQYHIIEKEVEEEIKKAENYLIEMENQFPDLVSIIQMKKAVCTILQSRKSDYQHYLKDGFIDQYQLNQALMRVDEKIFAVENLEMGLPEFSFYNLQYPIFASLTAYELQGIIESSRILRFNRGQMIYQQNQDIRQIYLIVAGSIADRVGTDTIVRSMGGFMSPANVLARNGKSYSTAHAETDCELRAIPLHIVWELMKNPMFRFKIFSRSIVYFVKLFKERAGMLGEIEENKLTQYLRKSNLEMIPNNHTLQLEFGGYLFEGEVSNQQGQVYHRYSFLPAGTYKNIVPIPVSIIRFMSKRQESKKHNHRGASIMKQGEKRSSVNRYSNGMMHNTADFGGRNSSRHMKSQHGVEGQEMQEIRHEEQPHQYTEEELQYYYWYMQQMQQQQEQGQGQQQ